MLPNMVYILCRYKWKIWIIYRQKKNRKPEKIVWITNMFMDDACSEREKFGTQSSTTYFFYKSRFVISVFFFDKSLF